ncbi:MAG: type I glyceraldehyde-3-phosphate dehydrogenase [Candidatus Ryanbacteria bacterium CG10_big_fil_rev_8_21_14_0_10_43_42]|uniref:Type I glyceraldehyde-3-phosphate dehydrogenase n=1 Tax=Candidatus Ryanbacteria bacterium CG10_big_fil_rev_8_21_14_0_10_43_42 TaxID=1974864 RepID=A0A2M8KWY8_9BACT|nr:MAG: type I glyceraldehyde-3-phosphate dehydrogenase [Candidatus Ryanbacteria bacterium CG10_big_fil_rev_8_21_14_0_10_43_42]
MRIAINGFGRIGRVFFRQAFGTEDIDIVAINDLGDEENLAYLLRYDTTYRGYHKSVKAEKGKLVVDGKDVAFFQEKDPAHLPWKDLDIDVVVESTGFFTTTEKAMGHITAGAGRVVISAPAKDEETPTATPNVGIDTLVEGRITSNASCTTNATTPVVAIMMKEPGIEKALLSTIHGYTSTQSLVDGPEAKDYRRGRAAAQNIVPSSTGAAKAVERAIPFFKEKFDGIAVRVPIISGSIIDFTFLAKRDTSAEEINDIFRASAGMPQWQGILRVLEDPVVSSDIIGEPYGSLVDTTLTRVVDGNLVKIMSWYDNEWGYAAMLLKHVHQLKNLL